MPRIRRRWRRNMVRRLKTVCGWFLLILFFNVLGWLVASRLGG